MITNLTAKDLIETEEHIAYRFDEGWIPGPIHLHNGCENQLIEIFKNINEDDFICSTWRSHYHCLLKGVPRHEFLVEIFSGHSITLNFPEYNIVSSAIVGNIFAVGVGLAQSIKLNKGKNKVWLFAGDMSFHSPYFYSCYRQAVNFDLPIYFICENNNKSVCTPTDIASGQLYPEPFNDLKSFKAVSHAIGDGEVFLDLDRKLGYFEYISKYEHSGTLTRTQF